MGNVTTIGLDLAKSVFQVHGVDEHGGAVLRQRLTRGRVLEHFAKLPPCLVGMEACASSHFWAPELMALGHEVKLMPAQYVKPYVKRGKNDAADAETICEAVTRPTMRFVGIKTPEQQSAMMLHRVRLILSRQRTQLSNALRDSKDILFMSSLDSRPIINPRATRSALVSNSATFTFTCPLHH